MSNINNQPVQHGLKRNDTGTLQSLWVELPGHCNLACSYCYACGGSPEQPENLLNWETYVSILEQAKAMGVDSVGIPGAGEPFVPKNKSLTLRFLHKCAELDMFVTLFTTGEFITEELADELYNLPVELMLKGNTLDPDKQDRFVSNPEVGQIRKGYGRKRNSCIELLMRKGFNNEAECMRMFGRKSRMALVTSIMTTEDQIDGLSNYDEMASILRFCRERNIIFDCDSVLKRGRAVSCTLCTGDQEIKAKLLEIQKIDREEFDNQWELSQSYVGTVCDRYRHHLYINQYGEIRPCIGAMDVNLGNIKGVSLMESWESCEMRIIRNRCYGGVCGTECQNFAEGKCNSCLGRRARNLTNEHLLEQGFVDTIGCWNFRAR